MLFSFDACDVSATISDTFSKSLKSSRNSDSNVGEVRQVKLYADVASAQDFCT